MKLEFTRRLVLWLFAVGIIMVLPGYQLGKWLAITSG